MSTPQPHDPPSTPLHEDRSVSTQNPEIQACVDTSSDEEFTTVEDVLIALDEQINTYLRAKHLFNVFHIEIGKTSNELHILVKERA